MNRCAEYYRTIEKRGVNFDSGRWMGKMYRP